VNAPAPRSLLRCLREGWAYAWSESREFVAIFAGMGVLAIAIGLCAADPAIVFGGLAILAALAFACIVYGSHNA
jgi:hypothetical protein